MKKGISIIGFAFSLVLFLYSLSFSEDKITITTYYPSPYGVYNVLRLYPTTQPASGQEGDIYYDSGGHVLKYHNGSAWLDIGVPRGTIVMWSGTIATIPTGWALCNGTGGTPDLGDKFILGTSAGENPGATGGTNSYSLTIAQLPAHTHTGTAAAAGSHSHSMWGGDNDNGDCGSGSSFDMSTESCRSVNSNLGGLHTHTLTINPVGTGEAIDNRPAFYKLAYIMKL
jgi:microcystin-dependent protein